MTELEWVQNVVKRNISIGPVNYIIISKRIAEKVLMEVIAKRRFNYNDGTLHIMHMPTLPTTRDGNLTIYGVPIGLDSKQPDNKVVIK